MNAVAGLVHLLFYGCCLATRTVLVISVSVLKAIHDSVQQENG